MQALHAARHEAAAEEVVRFLDDGSGRVLDVAHIGILTLQSPVLRAMLGSAMREACTSEVRVQGEFAGHWPQVVRFLLQVPPLPPSSRRLEKNDDLKRTNQQLEDMIYNRKRYRKSDFIENNVLFVLCWSTVQGAS